MSNAFLARDHWETGDSSSGGHTPSNVPTSDNSKGWKIGLPLFPVTGKTRGSKAKRYAGFRVGRLMTVRRMTLAAPGPPPRGARRVSIANTCSAPVREAAGMGDHAFQHRGKEDILVFKSPAEDARIKRLSASSLLDALAMLGRSHAYSRGDPEMAARRDHFVSPTSFKVFSIAPF